MIKAVLLIILDVLCSFVSGEIVTIKSVVIINLYVLGDLIQVSGHRAICSGDAAVFKCTNYKYGFINWSFQSIRGTRLSFSLNSENDPEGTNHYYYLESLPIEAYVISSNSSSITATVTIMQAMNLNRTVICCNGIESVLSVAIKRKGWYIFCFGYIIT